MQKGSVVNRLGWLILAVFVLLRVLMGWSLGGVVASLGPLLFVAILFGYACLHGLTLYGLKDYLAFLLIAFLVSWLYENCSIITGFPFGHYYYTDLLGPKLWHVPVFIMFAYAAVGYLAWVLSLVLLGRYQSPLHGKDLFFTPLVSAFVMVLWDVCMDPAKSTIAKQWVWLQGGNYFGVPMSNYAGWFLCVYTIFQLFAWYMRGKEKTVRHGPTSRRSFWIVPAWMYGAIMLEVLFLALSRPNVSVVSLDKQQWWTSDIYWSLTLIWAFTMVFLALLTTFKVLDNDFAAKHES